ESFLSHRPGAGAPVEAGSMARAALFLRRIAVTGRTPVSLLSARIRRVRMQDTEFSAGLRLSGRSHCGTGRTTSPFRATGDSEHSRCRDAGATPHHTNFK